MFVRSIPLAAIFLVAGCLGGGQIQVKGPDAQIARLSGEWQGNYKGTDSGREGTIKFNLGLGRHTAKGEVLMYAKGSNEPAQLPIEFVRVAGGKVSGKVGPYIDPQCACQVETEFLGDVNGNQIDGTFVTRIEALNLEQSGMWSVARQ